MELILTMEESDGGKQKSKTVHTQTDFGPYSAFPPPGYKMYYDNNQQQNVNVDGHKAASSDEKQNKAATTDIKQRTEN